MNDRNLDMTRLTDSEREIFDKLPLSWLVMALAVWVGLAVLLATLQYLQLQAPPTTLQLLTRMRGLMGESVDFFLWPIGLIVVIWLGTSLVLNRWDLTLVQVLTAGLRLGSGMFAVSALLWAGLAGWAFMQGDDPWEALPGITPPYLDKFLARHPALSVKTYSGTHWLFLYNEHGRSVYLDGDDLVDAHVRFQPCPPGGVDAAHLGGIPPYPGAQCDTVLHIRRGDVERVIYAFKVVRDHDRQSIESHFTHWAKTLGAEHGFQGERSRVFFTAHKGDSAWDLRLYTSRNNVRDIYIPKDGRTLAWAANGTAAPER